MAAQGSDAALDEDPNAELSAYFEQSFNRAQSVDPPNRERDRFANVTHRESKEHDQSPPNGQEEGGGSIPPHGEGQPDPNGPSRREFELQGLVREQQFFLDSQAAEIQELRARLDALLQRESTTDGNAGGTKQPHSGAQLQEEIRLALEKDKAEKAAREEQQAKRDAQKRRATIAPQLTEKDRLLLEMDDVYSPRGNPRSRSVPAPPKIQAQSTLRLPPNKDDIPRLQLTLKANRGVALITGVRDKIDNTDADNDSALRYPTIKALEEFEKDLTRYYRIGGGESIRDLLARHADSRKLMTYLISQYPKVATVRSDIEEDNQLILLAIEADRVPHEAATAKDMAKAIKMPATVVRPQMPAYVEYREMWDIFRKLVNEMPADQQPRAKDLQTTFIDNLRPSGLHTAVSEWQKSKNLRYDWDALFAYTHDTITAFVARDRQNSILCDTKAVTKTATTPAAQGAGAAPKCAVVGCNESCPYDSKNKKFYNACSEKHAKLARTQGTKDTPTKSTASKTDNRAPSCATPGCKAKAEKRKDGTFFPRCNRDCGTAGKTTGATPTAGATVCSRCNKPGHEADRCRTCLKCNRIQDRCICNATPSRGGGAGAGSEAPKNNKCYRCGQPGHQSVNCPNKMMTRKTRLIHEAVDESIGPIVEQVMLKLTQHAPLPASQHFASDGAGALGSMTSFERTNPAGCVVRYEYPQSSGSRDIGAQVLMTRVNAQESEIQRLRNKLESHSIPLD